jgi:catechol 2,3-dioxygenase-like lactoylglutathione lyase family enzyme
MGVRRIVPNVRAEEPAESRAFYCDLLGLEVAMDLGWVMTFAAPGHPLAQITVVQEDASASLHADVSIEVDDVDAVHAAAQRAGHVIVHPLTDEPWGVGRFFVRDPNGTVLNILSHS